METLWVTHARLVTPRGTREGAVKVVRGRIAEIRTQAPQQGKRVNLTGAYLAPGFIDLHIWGDPHIVSSDAARTGTTAFLSATGPASAASLLKYLAFINAQRGLEGARCLGAHLEGPFLNPVRAGALSARGMRRPTATELRAMARTGCVKLMTIAPELPGAAEAIRWCRAHGIAASLGHSDADAATAVRAIEAGASAVTHVFNGMRPLHHRVPSLLDVALTDPRLTTMVILDGVHISPSAFRLLVRAKGPDRVALVTDSIRHQGWDVVSRRGAYYTRRGTLAGSRLTMIKAVQHAVEYGDVPLADAVRMAAQVPATLLGLQQEYGALAVGKRADLVAFDRQFRVRMTMVSGTVVHSH